MKTGIVLEIHEDKAIILRSDGAFITRKPDASWAVGDQIELRPRGLRPLIIACIALALLAVAGGIGAQRILFESTSIISLDINPSLELELNSRGQVVAVVTYDETAQTISNELDLKWDSVEAALTQLFDNEQLTTKLTEQKALEVAVYASSSQDELLQEVTDIVNALLSSYADVDASIGSATWELVTEAHNHNMSIGKWKMLKQLEKVDPDANLTEYADAGIGAIRERIHECEAKHQASAQATGTQGTHHAEPGQASGEATAAVTTHHAEQQHNTQQSANNAPATQHHQQTTQAAPPTQAAQTTTHHGSTGHGGGHGSTHR